MKHFDLYKKFMLIALCLGCVTANNQQRIPDPPADIAPVMQRAHEGKVYMIFEPRGIWWLMSQRLCERYEGHLAIPYDEKTYKFLVQMIRDYYVKLTFKEREEMHGFHIGIRAVDGKWIPENIDWCSGEPKAQGACAEFSTKHGFCINDYKCSENRKRGVICEAPLFVIDQSVNSYYDPRIICLKPANFTEAKRKSSWYEAEKWCRNLGMTLVPPHMFKERPCQGGVYRRTPTAVDNTLLDGIWNADKQSRWCPGHPLPHRQCALQYGYCYRSVRCKDPVMQRYCCSLLVKGIRTPA